MKNFVGFMLAALQAYITQIVSEAKKWRQFVRAEARGWIDKNYVAIVLFLSVCLVFVSLKVAALAVVCFVSFPYLREKTLNDQKA